jgi:hypothetical protein
MPHTPPGTVIIPEHGEERAKMLPAGIWIRTLVVRISSCLVYV